MCIISPTISFKEEKSMPENNNENIKFEDISSSSNQFHKVKKQVDAYSNGIYKNLGNVIKAIAFIIAFAMIILGFILAFILLTKSAFSVVTSLAVIVAFTLLAAIVFFPLFGLGHIVCQNNEIIKLLKKQ